MASIKKYATAKGTAWRVQYRSPDGRSRTKQGFRTKAEAQRWADKNATTITEGAWTDPSMGKIRIEELWEMWKPSQHHLAESSMRTLVSSWDTHVKPRWGSIAISAVQTRDVQAWVDSMHADKKSGSVIHRAENLLSALADVAVRDQMIPRNPCDSVRLPSRKRREMNALTADQVKALIRQTLRYKSLVVFLAFTGARWGEAVALRVEDIDLVRRRATISRAASTVGGKVIIGETKTRKIRSIALPGVVVEALREEMRGKLPKALVWTNRRGQIVTTPSRRSWWHSAVDVCHEADDSFPAGLRIHDLRHTAASLLIGAGASVLVVQRQLGHASAKMTLDRYSHLFDGDLDEVVGAISDVVGLSWDSVNDGGLSSSAG